MSGCIYRTKDGECDLYSEGGKFKAFCDMEHCDNIVPTNADRIRAMTDEELAKYLNEIANGDCPVTDCPPGIRVNNTCTPWKCWLDWLKQEATDGT